MVAHYGVMGLVKAALEASVRYLAAELGPRARSASMPFPGADADPRRVWHSADQLLAQARELPPLRQPVDLEDVGTFCAFLVSDAKAITGDTHYVDGGFHILA